MCACFQVQHHQFIKRVENIVISFKTDVFFIFTCHLYFYYFTFLVEIIFPKYFCCSRCLSSFNPPFLLDYKSQSFRFESFCIIIIEKSRGFSPKYVITITHIYLVTLLRIFIRILISKHPLQLVALVY